MRPAVLRHKGYGGKIHVIPSLVWTRRFSPPLADREPRPFQIGYAGGLLEEKGVDLLFRACADWRAIGG